MKHSSLLKAAFCLITFALSTSAYFVAASKPRLRVELLSKQISLLPGEPVVIGLTVEDFIGFEAMKTRGCGYSKILVAKSGTEFKEVVGPGGFQLEECEIPFPREDDRPIQVRRKLLWNVVPGTDHLNMDAARNFQKGKIPTHFVFPEPGEYLIRGSLQLIDKDMPPIISNTIEISIDGPTGQDRAVWDRIQNKRDLAYFMQNSDFILASSGQNSQEVILAEIRQIIETYPESRYTYILTENLDRFRANLARRNIKKP